MDDINQFQSLNDWLDIDWRKVNNDINHVKSRIFRASYEKNYKKVTQLQRLLIKSKQNVLFSINKVSSEYYEDSISSQIDNKVILSNDQSLYLFQKISSIKLAEYSIGIRNRTFFRSTNKFFSSRFRLIIDRVIQTMVVNVLQPEWEPYFDPNCFGYRPHRNLENLLAHIRFNKFIKCTTFWNLTTRINSFSINTIKIFVLNAIRKFPYKKLVFQWLFHSENIFFFSDKDITNINPISPVLTHIALNGIHVKLKKFITLFHFNINVLVSYRYLDNMILFCPSELEILKVRQLIMVLLKQRGLQLCLEKTDVNNWFTGFDFVDFHFVLRFRYVYMKLLSNKVKNKSIRFGCRKKGFFTITLSKHLVRNIKNELSIKFKKNYGCSTDNLIADINFTIRRYAQLRQYITCNRVFLTLDSYIHQRSRRWIRRTHPSKSNTWGLEKYFKSKNDCVIRAKNIFYTQLKNRINTLFYFEMIKFKWFNFYPLSSFPLDLSKNSLNKDHKEYFYAILQKKLKNRLRYFSDDRNKLLLTKQQFLCSKCLKYIEPFDNLERCYSISFRHTTVSRKSMKLLHYECYHR